MKKILVLFLILFMSASVFALESPWERKLSFKGATIKYRVGGSNSGSKVLYIKNYGKNRAEYENTTMSVFGMKHQNKKLKITTPKWVYDIDLLKMSGTKQTNPTKFLNKEFHKLSKSKQKKVIKNSKKMAVDILKGSNGTLQLKATKILGYKCDKASMMGITTYSITGTDLALKVKGSLMGIDIDEEAISIKKGTPPSSKFKLPANIKIRYDKRADQMMEQQAKTIIQSLVEGKKVNSAHSAGGSPNMQGPKGQQYTPEQKKQMEQMLKMFGNQQ